MPHQCTKCGKIIPDASRELLNGCECGSRFFYYIRHEKLEELKRHANKIMEELDKADKDKIEQDIRELTGLDKKPDEPVILDLESVRVIKPGKFEIDIVNLFSKNRPIIYKLGEGKYIIDIESSLSSKRKTGKKYQYSNRLDIDEDDELTADEESIDLENENDSKKEIEEKIVEESENGEETFEELINKEIKKEDNL